MNGFGRSGLNIGMILLLFWRKISDKLEKLKKPSLYLIQPEQLEIMREDYLGHGYINKKVRAIFSYNNKNYNLAVTDLQIQKKYMQKESGYYSLQNSNVLLCISLGEPFMDFCYKLVATIIPL